MSNAAVRELQLINACIDDKSPHFFARNGITREWFTAYHDAYDFIDRHVRDHGEVPTLSTLVVACPSVEFFEYESIETVKRDLGDMLATTALEEWLRKAELGRGDYGKLKDAIVAKADEFQRKFCAKDESGIDVLRSGHVVLDEYEARKSGKVGVKIPTPFAALNLALGGGMETGDEAQLVAFTNRGKSWIAALFGETASYHGFKVVHAALEMQKARLLFRWHSLRSFRLRGRGFSNRGMLAGKLDEEAAFIEYVRGFSGDAVDGETPGYILKTRDDYANGLTLEQIERDIVDHGLSGGMYILDQLNLCNYHSLPGGIKEFHRKLVGIFARHNVVGLVMSQANGDSEKKKSRGDDGERVLQAPTMETAYSETIAVIQDARTVLMFDSLEADKRAVLVLDKATDGGVGTQVDLFWNPDCGEICEYTDELKRQNEAMKAIAQM